MYRLYWGARTGAFAPQVMLAELGLSCELVHIDLAAGEHQDPAYLAVNPAGRVPALVLPDGTVMGESAAMVLLLGERHPEGRHVPGPADPERARFLHWLLYMATSIYPALNHMAHAERGTTDPGGVEAVRAAARGVMDERFARLDEAIAGDPWFLPDGYGALDIYAAMLADWHPDRDALLERNPALARLCRAAEERDVFARVMAQHRG